jgi:Domain of unknown function (DUF3560)
MFEKRTNWKESNLLTITHTHAEGTLIDGTAKGDGTAEILKSCGWRWGRSIGAWYIPQSRDHLPNHYKIDRTVAALRENGHEVETDISKEIRTRADVEADKIARQADRVGALEAKAGRRAAAEDAARARVRHDIERMPPMGEPIKVGHHSEGRHRAAIARVDRGMLAVSNAYAATKEAQARADVAARTTDARYNPVTVNNRIEKMAADIRRIERSITAEFWDNNDQYRAPTEAEQAARAKRKAPRLAELKDQHEYWTAVRAEQIATGKANSHSKETINKGDAVKVRGAWYIVARANAKTVSVITEHGWINTSPYVEIQAHKTAEELAAAKAAKDAAQAE